MSKIYRILVGVLFFLGVTQYGFGTELKMGGLIFADYEYVTSKFLANGTQANNFNAFDVGRIYLNGSAKFDERFDSFLQLEMNILSRDNTANQAYLKQAWVRWNEIYSGASLRFGLVPTLWRGYEEGIWKHRFVAKILEDEEGLLNASDRGVLLSGRIPHVDYEAEVSNGEGTGGRTTAGNEVNKFKDYALRLAVSPFKEGALNGFKANTLIHKGFKVGSWPRDRNIYGLSYESKGFNLWGAYYRSRDGFSLSTGTGTVSSEGFSFFGVLNCPHYPAWIFARWDLFNPRLDIVGDAHQRFIYGIGYQLAEGIRISVDHQLLKQETEIATRKNQSIVFTHLEVKF
ncbi:MAG: hypothetical protein HY400_05730 [Elusimicrobia bacterium]|nr:hypothetical protein [Elusimicrobiota bacterium]